MIRLTQPDIGITSGPTRDAAGYRSRVPASWEPAGSDLLLLSLVFPRSPEVQLSVERGRLENGRSTISPLNLGTLFISDDV